MVELGANTFTHWLCQTSDESFYFFYFLIKEEESLSLCEKVSLTSLQIPTVLMIPHRKHATIDFWGQGNRSRM